MLSKVILVAEVIGHYRRFARACGTQEDVLERLERRIGHFRIGDVDQVACDRYVDRYHTKSKPGSIVRELSVIQALISFAAKRSWCVPWTIERPAVDDARIRELSPAEQLSFLAALEPHGLPYFMFLLSTGARPGEARALQWPDVHPDGVIFTTRKGGGFTRRRKVPLNKGAKQALDMAKLFWGSSGHVFRDEHGQPWRDRHGPILLCRAACAKAGIEDFRPHDCRHTFATRLMRKGTHLKAVADLLGHKDVSMTSRYSHVCPAMLQQAVDII